MLLNVPFPEYNLGLWGVITVIIAFMFVLADKMKGPTERFGPNERFKAYSALVGRIKSSESYLKVIDIHPGIDTLTALAAAPVDLPVRFLTLTINLRNENDVFMAAAKRLLGERTGFEIRIADKSVFHDRWILTEPHGYHLTQSIKDLGNKIGAIIEMSVEETQECVKDFDDYWTRSEPLAV